MKNIIKFSDICHIKSHILIINFITMTDRFNF